MLLLVRQVEEMLAKRTVCLASVLRSSRLPLTQGPTVVAARLSHASFWLGYSAPNLPSLDPWTRELVSGRDSRGLCHSPRRGEAGGVPVTLHPLW